MFHNAGNALIHAGADGLAQERCVGRCKYLAQRDAHGAHCQSNVRWQFIERWRRWWWVSKQRRDFAQQSVAPPFASFTQFFHPRAALGSEHREHLVVAGVDRHLGIFNASRFHQASSRFEECPTRDSRAPVVVIDATFVPKPAHTPDIAEQFVKTVSMQIGHGVADTRLFLSRGSFARMCLTGGPDGTQDHTGHLDGTRIGDIVTRHDSHPDDVQILVDRNTDRVVTGPQLVENFSGREPGVEIAWTDTVVGKCRGDLLQLVGCATGYRRPASQR